VVLGGGILGVEAALAIREQGARAALVHHGDIPLARALDHDGGRLLSAALTAAGVDVVPQARAVAVRLEEGRFTGLELGDGTVVPGDLLVLSVGVRARAELAEGCGLAVDRGIVVDRFLRADTEDRVFAIGDCAAVAGRPPSGLIGPGWTQAAWLAGYLAKHPAPGFLDGPGSTAIAVEPPAAERPGVILLKARGVDVAAGGDVSAGPWDSAVLGNPALGSGPQRVAVWADPQQGRYCKMATIDGVLTGFVAVGMPRTAAELVLLYERGAELPADRSTLFRLDDAAMSLPSAPAGPDDVLCRCSGATHGQVRHAVGEGCSSVEQVGASCRAGTGCGGCRDKIEALLASATSTI
jgi:assimilatory nitrate reductase electron transfer subunit